MTSFQSEARLEVVVEPVNGGGEGNGTSTIGNAGVCQTALSKGQECVLVVFVDRQQQEVLLRIPNKLGWKLHFGCDIPASADGANGALLWSAARETAQQTVGDSVGGNAADLKLRPAGLMLFTFTEDDHPPMRVRVFEATLRATTNASAANIGKRYAFDNIPFDEMWADDKWWMPTLLKGENGYFEAHFVFRGPPGASSPLVQQSYKTF